MIHRETHCLETYNVTRFFDDNKPTCNPLFKWMVQIRLWYVTIAMLCGPYMVTFLNQTPTFDWHIQRFVLREQTPKRHALR